MGVASFNGTALIYFLFEFFSRKNSSAVEQKEESYSTAGSSVTRDGESQMKYPPSRHQPPLDTSDLYPDLTDEMIEVRLHELIFFFFLIKR